MTNKTIEVNEDQRGALHNFVFTTCDNDGVTLFHRPFVQLEGKVLSYDTQRHHELIDLLAYAAVEARLQGAANLRHRGHSMYCDTYRKALIALIIQVALDSNSNA